MAYTRPAYPAVLTKANWDKNKGILAKMAGYTGMGESLTKLKAAYDKVNWDRLEVGVHKPNPKEFTLQKLEALKNGAVAEMNGSAAALRVQAFATRDLAKKTEAQYKANKAIPSSATALCGQIAAAADHLGVGANTNSLGSYIETDVKEARAAFDLTFQTLKTGLAPRIAALEKALGAMGDPTPEIWHTKFHMMTLCRDVNQLIGNVPKLAGMGYNVGLDSSAAKSFFDEMMVYASKEAPFDDVAGGKKAKAAVSALVVKAKKITK